MVYRNYIADSLRLAAQNKYLVKRYADFVFEPQIVEQNATDIAADIINRHGLILKDG